MVRMLTNFKGLKKMMSASDKMEYEEAAKYKSYINTFKARRNAESNYGWMKT